jgi:hypothetical protein
MGFKVILTPQSLDDLEAILSIHAAGQKNFNAKTLRREEEFALGSPARQMVGVGHGAKFASCPCDSATLRLCVKSVLHCSRLAESMPSKNTTGRI